VNEWIKAWRPRPGSAFEARVSPLAKDWFRGLLVHFDDSGVMHLPKSKTPHGALGMALGYSKGQRRTIAGLMAECMEHGCLVAEQDGAGFWTLSAPAWTRFQAPKRGDKRKPPTAPPTEVTPRSSTSPRTRQVPAAYPESKMGTDRGSRTNAKCPESFDTDSAEKRREEERQREGARANFRDPLGERDRVTPGAFVTRLYVMAMRELSDPTWDEMRLTGRDRERLVDMTQWATGVADAHERQGSDWARAYAQALTGSLDVWRDEAKQKAGVPLSPGGWWARREQWRQAA
jgi:hypothetical protein